MTGVAWRYGLSYFIFQYIVTNSVEERMLTLQDQKRELMGQAFGLEAQSQEDRRRARVRDIKHLIGLWFRDTGIYRLVIGHEKIWIIEWRIIIIC